MLHAFEGKADITLTGANVSRTVSTLIGLFAMGLIVVLVELGRKL